MTLFIFKRVLHGYVNDKTQCELIYMQRRQHGGSPLNYLEKKWEKFGHIYIYFPINLS